jgi:hypothetical protein
MKRVKITEDIAYPKSSALDRFTGVGRPAAIPEAKQDAPAAASPRSSMIKLSVFLQRDEDAYLEQLASTAKFSGGKKLSKTRLIEAMVRAFRQTGLDVRGVKDDQELLNRVAAQLNK